MKNVVRIWFSVMLLALAACKSHDVSSVEMASQSMYAERVAVDSIVVHDSIYIREKSDTVFCTRYRTLYKERLRRDTIMLCDTIVVERVVEIGNGNDSNDSGWNRLWLLAVLFLLWRSGLLNALLDLIKKL